MSAIKLHSAQSQGASLARLVRAPLVKWERRVNRLPDDKRLDLAKLASAHAERFVLLSEYLAGRALCSHKTAAHCARKRVVKCRRAMGYTYPERGLAEVQF